MKKIIRTLEKLDFRSFIVCLIGVVMARTSFYSMNPAAIGYFAAAYTYRKSRILLLISMLIGLGTTGDTTLMMKYGAILLVIVFITYLSEKQEKLLSITAISILSGLVTSALLLMNGFQTENYIQMIILAILEGLLVMASANMFYLAVDFIKNGSLKRLLTNQEMISLCILSGCVLYGLPDLQLYGFSVIETAAYLIIVFLGYKYGAGAGAVAGTVCGAVLCLSEYNLSLVGIFCLLGITAGVFRELGRFATVVVFATVNIMLCYANVSEFLEVAQIRALVSAMAVFMILPRRLTRRIDLRTSGDELRREKKNIQSMAQDKLDLFSQSFQKLSKSFYTLAQTRSELEQNEVGDVFDSMALGLCQGCKNCKRCWNTNYYKTQQAKRGVVDAVKEKGYVIAKDFPQDFRDRCLSFDQFVYETNRELTVASINLSWSNRMAESRLAVAGQLGEVAEIIDEFSKSLQDTMEVEVEDENEEMMKNFLKAYHLDVKKISVMEKRNHRRQLFMSLRTRKGRCITTREAADLASKVYGKKLKPSVDSKNVIPKEYDTIQFIEDTNFQTITGMARVSKDGEKVSGDTFSFMNLDQGETVMILSDGMGTGERAREESEIIIDLLEEFLEAGFSECTAIKLINSILVLNSDYQTVSTLDISSIDLYTGMCNFVKIGASTTFIKRNGWIESIQSTNLPVGMFNEIDIEDSAKKLYDGDYVVMVSDGMLDYMDGIDKEEIFKELLINIHATNPQEMANEILEQVMNVSAHEVRDDMTVLVAGFWEKI